MVVSGRSLPAESENVEFYSGIMATFIPNAKESMDKFRIKPSIFPKSLPAQVTTLSGASDSFEISTKTPIDAAALVSSTTSSVTHRGPGQVDDAHDLCRNRLEPCV